MTYHFERDKASGTAVVEFEPGTISNQKADSIGRAAFHVPAKFVMAIENDGMIRRYYYVPDWNNA